MPGGTLSQQGCVQGGNETHQAKAFLLPPHPPPQVPGWMPAVLSVVPSSGFICAHRFGAALRLLRNIGMWGVGEEAVLTRERVDRLALDSLMTFRILPHLNTLLSTPHDAVGRVERLVGALRDGGWCGGAGDVRWVGSKSGFIFRRLAWWSCGC